MKILKVIVFLGIVIYWISGMNENIKGQGLFGSLISILVLIAFIYGAYTLFFKRDS